MNKKKIFFTFVTLLTLNIVTYTTFFNKILNTDIKENIDNEDL